MPEAEINGTRIHYDCQGSGEPLVLIPFLTADHACFAFQLPAYAEHFTCYPVDLRGSGATARGDAGCTMAQFVEDVAAFIDSIGAERAHLAGYSLGGAVAMSFAAAYPQKVRSLSLHSTWPRSDPYLQGVVASWQIVAEALGDVCEAAIAVIFPWCFTPERYAEQPELIQSVIEFARSRPKQRVGDFLEHSTAVIRHDALDALRNVRAPTQVSFGSADVITSTRFAEPFLGALPHAELEIFEGCSHASFFEDAEGFNRRTLDFLKRSRAAS
jgi:pimeloyl-ACP methyl ester carboxylesterase